MNDKVDAIGRQLNIGDFVLFSGTHTGVEIGKISKFTKIKIQIDGMNRYWGGSHYPSDLFLISESNIL